mmetsp:Transcript_15129/g.22906  ORF Transcript_15129/g.22906 Transcript_15129/m.22906 type:complete len:220 (-) Transcript_15129:508-1167(-)
MFLEFRTKRLIQLPLTFILLLSNVLFWQSPTQRLEHGPNLQFIAIRQMTKHVRECMQVHKMRRNMLRFAQHKAQEFLNKLHPNFTITRQSFQHKHGTTQLFHMFLAHTHIRILLLLLLHNHTRRLKQHLFERRMTMFMQLPRNLLGEFFAAHIHTLFFRFQTQRITHTAFVPTQQDERTKRAIIRRFQQTQSGGAHQKSNLYILGDGVRRRIKRILDTR